MTEVVETRLLLIRHCQAAGLEPESPLTGPGVAEAQALAARLATLPIDAIYSSPFKRATATVGPMAAERGRAVKTELRLQERRLSLAPVPDWREHVRRSFADADYSLPGGESFADVRQRGFEALREIAERRHALAAVSTHGQFLAALLSAVRPDFGYEAWLALKNPHVIATRWRGGKLISFTLG